MDAASFETSFSLFANFLHNTDPGLHNRVLSPWVGGRECWREGGREGEREGEGRGGREGRRIEGDRAEGGKAEWEGRKGWREEGREGDLGGAELHRGYKWLSKHVFS